MNNFILSSHPEVKKVFETYPKNVKPKLESLRNLVIETAKEIEGLTALEETLKWGEPSFVTKHGSTLRIDWKSKNPNQYAMYFQCSTRLVETFKLFFEDAFTFEGKRAIIFQLNDPLPIDTLKKCIKASLTYHKVKHLPSLGI